MNAQILSRHESHLNLHLDAELVERLRNRLPHPLARFAVNGAVIESPEADAVLEAIQTAALADHDSENTLSARLFLLEGEQFCGACAVAGLDARKLRRHLRRALSRAGLANRTGIVSVSTAAAKSTIR